MKKHAIIFASLALSCLVLSAPLSAGAVSSFTSLQYSRNCL